MKYYVFDGSKAHGPFEAAVLLKSLGFTAKTLVRPVNSPGADSWKPASSFPDLLEALKTRPTPAAPDPAALEASLNALIDAAGPNAMAEPAAPSRQAPSHSAPSHTAPAPAGGLGSPTEKLIMIVDDDDNVRQLIESGARMAGFLTMTAVDGKDASSKLEKTTPDLIVTDLMMPGQGGYEFLRDLQAAGMGPVPVFVVTGRTLDASTVAMIKQEGNVVEFIGKPINLSKFVDALHKHLKTAPLPKKGKR